MAEDAPSATRRWVSSPLLATAAMTLLFAPSRARSGVPASISRRELSCLE
jgi:hypothetical protein